MQLLAAAEAAGITGLPPAAAASGAADGEEVAETALPPPLPALLVLVLFLGSVVLLFLHAFWTRDGFSLVYFRQIVERADYHEVFLRTVRRDDVLVARAPYVLGDR